MKEERPYEIKLTERCLKKDRLVDYDECYRCWIKSEKYKYYNDREECRENLEPTKK